MEDDDKLRSHMSHKLSREERVPSCRPFYGFRIPTFNHKPMSGWYVTGKRRLGDDPSLQTAPYGIREELYNHWLQIYQSQSEGKTLASSRRLFFYNICNSYRDVLCPNCSGKSSFVDSYLIHLLNHSLKSIDQGVTRPKVLILVPLARDAHLLVRRLFQLYPSANMANAAGFENFNTRIVQHTENDDFIFSIKLERENVTLYSSYNNSDILVASPLALVSKIWLDEKTGKKDADRYLSSIELLLVDYSREEDCKNLAYVPKIVAHLNSRPVSSLRPWHDDGEAQFYRQTIILSSSVNQDIKDLFYRHCMNFEGKMEFSYFYTSLRRFPSSPQLPLGHCIIAMSYPPGNKLLSFVKRSKVQDFFIEKGFPRDFAAHGAWEGNLNLSNVRNLKEDGNEPKLELNLSEDWKNLLGLCMPNVTRAIAIKNMTSELERHGRYIDFLDENTYAQFVISVFLRYRFDVLMRFLCNRVRTVLEPEDVSRIHYLRHDWIGISVTHFTQFLQEYDPIYGSDLITKVFSYDGRFFFYELCTFVTKEGKLAQAKGDTLRANFFDGKDLVRVEIEDHDIVYFLSV